MSGRLKKLKKTSIFDTEAVHELFREYSIPLVNLKWVWQELLKDQLVAKSDKELWEIVAGIEGCSRKLVNVLRDRRDTWVGMTSTIYEKKDGERTSKIQVELQDGQRVEAVIIKHQDWNTLCVSSQVGCKMACAFCATGTMGLLGNLSSGEICEQLIHARTIAPITRIVFMGMGE